MGAGKRGTFVATYSQMAQNFDYVQTSTSGDGWTFQRDLAAASTDSPVMKIHQNNATDDQATLICVQDGTATNLLVDTDGQATSIDIDSEATTSKAMIIQCKGVSGSNAYGLEIANTGTAAAQVINQTGILGAGHAGLKIECTGNQTGAGSAAIFPIVPAGSTMAGIRILQNGTGPCINCESTTGPSINLASLTTAEKTALTASNGSLAYDETLHKLCIYANGGWETVTSV